jgi:hypothetical protein
LELVQDMTTEAFLQALGRFISRRGKPKNLYSDNGSNFKGAKNELDRLYGFFNSRNNAERIDKFCADKGIQWNFIPPRSPSMGGEWEAAVKSFKFHFLRMAGRMSFTVIEMQTVLCKIEAILNSRPLVAEFSDPNDMNAITPGHFLIGRSLVALPEHDWEEINLNRLTRWEKVQEMSQYFWNRWTNDYLHSLQIRAKNFKKEIEFFEGQFVVLRDENKKPINWSMGRICKLFPGADGITRVVEVRTKDGIYRRGVNKLCVLPIET